MPVTDCDQSQNVCLLLNITLYKYQIVHTVHTRMVISTEASSECKRLKHKTQLYSTQIISHTNLQKRRNCFVKYKIH